MMKRNASHTWLWIVLLACVSLAPGCGTPAGQSADARRDEGQPVAGGTLIYGRGHDAVGLDPAHETDGESFKVCDNLYENLVAYDVESTELVPELATHWEISEDGKTYTFHLRQDVRFHDGTPLNAEAVVFSLDRQRDKNPPHEFHSVGGPYTYWSSMSMDEIVRDIRSADDSTVVIELNRPNAPFLANLAMGFAVIVSPTALREHRDDYFKNPVGTGPFRFVEWVKDDRIVIERNPDYWGTPPYLDRVVIRSIPENTVRFLALEQGEIEAMDGVSPLEARRIERTNGIYLMRKPGMNVGYLPMHMERAPFDKREVRLALNHAINKQALVDGLYMGYGTVAVNPIPPTIWSYNTEIEGYAYDPDRARELLAEAGVPEGTKFTLMAMSNPRPYMPEPMKVAEVIQADLREVGLDVEIRTMEWGTYLDYLQNLNAQASLIGWSGDNGDPDNFLYVLLDKEAARIPAQNYSAYKSEELHEVLVAAQVSSDQAERERLYLQAQEIIHRDVPWVPIAHMDQLWAFRNHVHGFKIHPTGKLRLRTTWVDPAS